MSAARCTDCRAELVAGARWCGRCGAPIAPEPPASDDVPGPLVEDPAEEDEDLAEEDEEQGEPGDAAPDVPRAVGRVRVPPGRWRRVLAGGAAAAVLLAVVGTVTGPSSASSYVGRQDVDTGASTDTAPPEDLVVQWVAERAAPGRAVTVDPVGVGAGHVALDGVVRDLRDGSVAATPGEAATAALRGTELVVVDAGVLHVVDATTGAVVSRARVDPFDAWEPVGPAVAVAGADVVLQGTDGRLGRVSDTGRVRWVSSESLEVRGPVSDGWLLAVEPAAPGRPSRGHVVLDVATGRAVLLVSPISGTPLLVAGDVLLMGPPWGRRLALPDGRVVRAPALETGPPVAVRPRLLADGSVVVVGADGVADAPSATRVEPVSGRRVARVGLGPPSPTPYVGRAVVADTERVVAVVDGDLRGSSWDEQQRWRTRRWPSGSRVELTLVDDAVVVEAGDVVQVIGRDDGRLRTRFPSRTAAPVRVVAVDAGALVLGAPGVREPESALGLASGGSTGTGASTSGAGPDGAGQRLVTPDGDVVRLRPAVGTAAASLTTADGTVAGVGSGTWTGVADASLRGPLLLVAEQGVQAPPVLVAVGWDGTPLWRRAGIVAVDGVGDLVVVRPAGSTRRGPTGHLGPLEVLDAGDGSVRWTLPATRGQVLGPVVVGRTPAVLVVGPAEVTARAAADGRVLWRAPLAAWAGAQPVVVDRTVVVPLTDGTAVGLDLRDGRARWQFDTGHVAAATAAGDSLFLLTREGDLLRLTADGALVRRRVGLVRSPPLDVVAVGDLVVVVAADEVLALGPADDGLPSTDLVELP